MSDTGNALDPRDIRIDWTRLPQGAREELQRQAERDCRSMAAQARYYLMREIDRNRGD